MGKLSPLFMGFYLWVLTEVPAEKSEVRELQSAEFCHSKTFSARGAKVSAIGANIFAIGAKVSAKGAASSAKAQTSPQ
jgi:hypothetical protein